MKKNYCAGWEARFLREDLDFNWTTGNAKLRIACTSSISDDKMSLCRSMDEDNNKPREISSRKNKKNSTR